MDNLSTHSAGALYQAFPPDEARRILRRLEFHYVPKHASWLNMVEIEIGVLRSQCLNRRIDERKPGSVAKSPPGNDSAIPNAPASNGCSQPKKPAPKWGTLTRSPRSNQTKIKSQYLCDEKLVAKSIFIKDAKRRFGNCARKATELTPGGLLRVPTFGTEGVARRPDRGCRSQQRAY